MSLVCRVCLAGNTILHSLENNLLVNIYEKLSKSNSEDTRPKALCYICYQELIRCHTFSQMVCNSEKIFSNLFQRGLEPTEDNITEADRRMQQHLSIATVQFDTIDGSTTNAGYQVIIKDEPISYYDKEEAMTPERNKVIEVPESCAKSQQSLEENQSDQDNQVTIKYEPIQSIVIKKDILVEVDSVNKDSFKSYCIFEEENSNQGSGAAMEERLLNINYQPTKPDVSELQFCCKECHKLFVLKSELISHINSTHSQYKRKEYQHFENYTMNTSMNEDIDNQMNLFSCDVCDKQFNDEDKLLVHMSIHTDYKLFACNVCDERFEQICPLVEHMKIHTGDKLFICHVCDKQFNQKGKLIKHITVHTGEKPFACDVCDKRFRRKCDLAVHTRIHTGDKLFTCQLCNKQVNKKSDFADHMLLHTGEKPFSCNVCNKVFRRKCDLYRHKKTHTGEKPFACNLCNERFRRKYVLDMHMSIHTGEKKFTCCVCDKQYNRKFALDRHMIIHSGDKPFACNVCNKQFNLKCNLTRHMRLHIG